MRTTPPAFTSTVPVIIILLCIGSQAKTRLNPDRVVTTFSPTSIIIQSIRLILRVKLPLVIGTVLILALSVTAMARVISIRVLMLGVSANAWETTIGQAVRCCLRDLDDRGFNRDLAHAICWSNATMAGFTYPAADLDRCYEKCKNEQTRKCEC